MHLDLHKPKSCVMAFLDEVYGETVKCISNLF